MIYLLRKHDIISVPAYAEGIYHRTIVRYHIEDISPVPQGTDIIVKKLFCLIDKRVFLHGGDYRARTCDLLLVRQMLSQLSYAPEPIATAYCLSDGFYYTHPISVCQALF